MALFNKRNRDNRGAGKIRLEDEGPKKNDKGPKKTALIIGGSVVAIGLIGVFLFATGGDDNTDTTQPPVVQHPPIVITAPPVVTTQPVINEPVITVQSTREKVGEKVNSIFNRNGCLYEAFVSNNGREVGAGNDFSYFACLYDEGGMGVLITDGEWAGTRVSFIPRDASVSVEIVGQTQIGEDNRTVEYYRLSHDQRTSYSSSMASPEFEGDGVNISTNADRFTKTVRQSGQTSNAFIIADDPSDGVFEIEIPNGDVYQINLNTGDFYADSLFLNCPGYSYGNEASCPRDNFQPVNGNIPQLDALK